MSQDLVKENKALQTMDLAGLKAKYNEVFGSEPVGRNKKVLIDQIRRRLFQQDIERQRKERTAGKSSANPKSVTERIATLTKMSLEDLRQEYETVIGKKSRSRNRRQLTKRIADALQKEAYQEKMAGGGKPTLTAKFERKKKTPARRVTRPKAKKGTRSKRQYRQPGQRDPRLPQAGTTITRTYKGKTLLVRVLDEGFEYQGKPFRSLSALANHITGQIINGYLFFKLTGETKKS